MKTLVISRVTPQVLAGQVWRLRWYLLGGGGVIVLALLAVYGVSVAAGVPLSALTRDPAAVGETAPYIGMLSILSVMWWAGAVAICLLGFGLTRGLNIQGYQRFFLISAAITALLALDDAFMFHEKLFPDHLNLSENVVYVIYIGIIISYMFAFGRIILSTDYVLFIIAGMCLAASLVFDKLVSFGDIETFIEDGLKFAGIVFWSLYFSQTLIHLCTAQHHPYQRVSRPMVTLRHTSPSAQKNTA